MLKYGSGSLFAPPLSKRVTVLGIAHLVGETVVLVCGDDQAVCDTATDTCAQSVHTGSGLMHVSGESVTAFTVTTQLVVQKTC